MASGGSRNRSGPSADPNSERSQQRGLTYKLLPREGFTGRVPAFPLPAPSARERAIWRELWRTPQAAMWNVERHRMMSVGHYCRLLVRAEAIDCPVGVHTQLHRYADQLGITPAGMRENGWRVQADEVAQKRTESDAPAPVKAPAKSAPKRRLRAV